MSDRSITAPARKLDEFEELVFEYTGRMGQGSEEVCATTTSRLTSTPSSSPAYKLKPIYQLHSM
jgi:hypothetical protein